MKTDVFEIVNDVDNDNYNNDDMPGDEKTDIATTDEYQGLQNDIVLVSLLRQDNDHRHICQIKKD